MAKAVALLSGGLDSTLAILVMLRQGIEVTAVTFLTHFGCDISDSSSCSKNPFPAAEKFGFKVKLCHLADKFIEIVKNPYFGHGRNMNPCIDCRILMLREAKEFMGMIGADFIVTGEVLGQRPMSQRRDTLHVIDREAGLRGYVLRPLSAKLFAPTVPEKEGFVKRDRLLAISGRSRKPQMALAEELGLTDFPAPAGGCLLTEPNFAYRLRELFGHDPNPSLDNLRLLRFGRHFRFSPRCKAIVGRDEKENEVIASFAEKRGYVLHVKGVGSPIVFLSGDDSADYITLAASLCARYSDARNLSEVEVTVGKAADSWRISVPPATDTLVGNYRIGRRERASIKVRLQSGPDAQKDLIPRPDPSGSIC
jgi:hypothetical protein